MNFIKRNLDRIVLGIILLFLFVCIIFYLFNTLKKEQSVPEAEKIDEIVEYNYYLHEDDTDLYRAYFGQLKDILSTDSIDYDKYANVLTSLFVIDFFNLDNKTTNMDIGGVQYLHSSIKDNFILKASDTIYKNVKSNIYGDRNQELPIVSDVVIKSIDNLSFEYNNIKDDKAYDIVVTIKYEKDLGYPEEINLTIIREKDKLVIVEVNN